MAEKKPFEVSIETLTEIAKGHRIIDRDVMWEFYRVLDALWQREAKDLPEDFRLKLFSANQYFYDYFLNEPGLFRPSPEVAMKSLQLKVPKAPV